MNVIMERYPYRYVELGTLDNGKPDFRIQKENYYTKRYNDMYLCDSGMQMMQAMKLTMELHLMLAIQLFITTLQMVRLHIIMM